MTWGWRPFEQSRDEYERIQRDVEMNTCNLHENCDAADEAVRSRGGRIIHDRLMDRDEKVMHAFHCSDEDCEDCFGC